MSFATECLVALVVAAVLVAVAEITKERTNEDADLRDPNMARWRKR